MEQPAMINQDKIQALEAMGNKLRIDSIVSTSEAGSGHPTTCMSAADLISAIFFHAMRYDVHNPKNPVNDRFVLSKGHAAPILYAVWVEAATGSLGQGLSNAVGMALNSKYLDRIDNRVYALMGDGEAAEGSIWEAAEIAAYYKLDNLVGIVDVK